MTSHGPWTHGVCDQRWAAFLRKDLCAATGTEFEEITASECDRQTQSMLKINYECVLLGFARNRTINENPIFTPRRRRGKPQVMLPHTNTPTHQHTFIAFPIPTFIQVLNCLSSWLVAQVALWLYVTLHVAVGYEPGACYVVFSTLSCRRR